MRNTLITIPFLFFNSNLFGQSTFHKTFKGSWASTRWEFKFFKDGTFHRSSNGHYGNTLVKGTYKIYNDTLEILKGYQNTNATVNQYYLIEGKDCIIDLYLRYDYVSPSSIPYHNSSYRQIKYPQVPFKNIRWKQDLDSTLNIAFNSLELIKYINNDFTKDKSPIIANYFELNQSCACNFTIKGFTPQFLALEKIKDSSYIEIEDINQNQKSIDIKVKIYPVKESIWFYFKKEDNHWTYKII